MRFNRTKKMNNKMDKLSRWLKETVQGGQSAPLEVSKQGGGFAQRNEPAKAVVNDMRNSGGSPVRKGNKSKYRGKVRGNAKAAPRASRTGKVAQKSGARATIHKNVMRIIPIGGLEEVGKNAMLVEYEDEILSIDMGFQFPEDEMLGVDYIIPDIKYLTERRERLKGILITHGHLDHIGALPFVLEDLGFPDIYGSKLSLGLVTKRLEEFKMEKKVKLIEVVDKKAFNIGRFEVEFFHVNHSIPDSKGLTVRTPDGSTMLHTGDFKFDFTPADGVPADIGKIAEIGRRGVHIMFSDSTNATKPGHTISESIVAESLNEAIEGAGGRIIITSFASLIGRVQQILDFAHTHNRKVFLSGRSMIENVEIAHNLGFIKTLKGLVLPIKDVNNYKDEEVMVLTTGSQGEPMAALSRMANDSHAQVKIKKGDTVVVSASPIIGNEKAVAFLVDKLCRLGATIIHNRIMDVHTSGHGQQEDLKMMLSLVKPDHFVPIHGNYYMRSAHGLLGVEMGIPEANVHMMDNGNVIEIRGGVVSFKKEDVKVNYVVVDGHGVGDAGSQVLKDREAMSQNGAVTIVFKTKSGRLVGSPEVITHGFVYQKETEKVVAEIEREAKSAFNKFNKTKPGASIGDLERYIKSNIVGYIVRRLDRRPLVSSKVVRI